MNRRHKENVKSFFWYIGAVAIAAITIYPFLWMIATSFKQEGDIFAHPLSLIPESFSWDNYTKLFDTIPFGRYFINSAILAVSGAVTNVFLGALAGYAYAKLKFKGKKMSFRILLTSMMIPGVVTMIPQFLILKFFP